MVNAKKITKCLNFSETQPTINIPTTKIYKNIFLKINKAKHIFLNNFII